MDAAAPDVAASGSNTHNYSQDGGRHPFPPPACSAILSRACSGTDAESSPATVQPGNSVMPYVSCPDCALRSYAPVSYTSVARCPACDAPLGPRTAHHLPQRPRLHKGLIDRAAHELRRWRRPT